MPSLTSRLATGRVLLMDGAMGTELFRAGLAPGECAERWNLSHPERVLAIHRAYVAAGSDVLLTNTFQANPLALARFGLAGHLMTLIRAAIRLARQAAGPERVVLGSVGPIVTSPPYLEFGDRSLLAEVAAAMVGVDGLLLETCSSPRALEAIAYLHHRSDDLAAVPLLLSLTYERNPAGQLVTHSGHPPETYARHAAGHGVAALGVNCGRDLKLADVAEIVRRYRAMTDLPLFAKPNAGPPGHELSPAAFAEGMTAILEAGATMVGGCCGTTAEHVREIREGQSG